MRHIGAPGGAAAALLAMLRQRPHSFFPAFAGAVAYFFQVIRMHREKADTTRALPGCTVLVHMNLLGSVASFFWDANENTGIRKSVVSGLNSFLSMIDSAALKMV